jgi:polyisoprenoid-binding protein YceI
MPSPTLLKLALFAAIGSAQAAAVDYRIDPAHTQVTWEVRHFGTSTHRGRFTDVSAAISLDREGRSGQLSVTIGTAGVDSGVRALDGMLRGKSFLASDTHPSAYFVASRFVFDGDGLKEAVGEFTLRGVSRPMTLHALQFACRLDDASGREACGGDFEAEFLRSDFGISYGLPFVGNKVRLVIQVEALREAAGG